MRSRLTPSPVGDTLFVTTGPFITGSLVTPRPHSHITHEPGGFLEEAHGTSPWDSYSHFTHGETEAW